MLGARSWEPCSRGWRSKHCAAMTLSRSLSLTFSASCVCLVIVHRSCLSNKDDNILDSVSSGLSHLAVTPTYQVGSLCSSVDAPPQWPTNNSFLSIRWSHLLRTTVTRLPRAIPGISPDPQHIQLILRRRIQMTTFHLASHLPRRPVAAEVGTVMAMVAATAITE